jgi:hypothetical protein
MSKEKTDRAERDRQEKADKDKAKTARKIQDKADKTEKERVDKARKVQEKVDKVEKERVESARQSERARMFEEVLNRASAHSKGCCEPCDFHVKTNDGKYQPCRLGHEDSGPNKEICADCTDERYHPKK